MTEKSIIATEKIAEFLKEIMKEKGVTTYQLEQKGIHKTKIYSVLRMGNVARPNYTIETFIEVLGAIGIHLELHDLSQKSNLNLDKTGQN
jgi:DNA-binding phage protein